ncbi:adenosylcobinamide-GDP ribazoletransferase [Halovenus sp. WSH3]|uniref:Adenosylcobinamide-GDP ribazoletransferase n=1 Tax=Halovenus carboxidivorans TaxID=2692199 RepID=A0A6B0T196_9EURY|nr:adenosylcobinamide-GDP ribazoletransferase [Halovenus carboxidivorans]MXR50016.1 adenosylcobinamide-GDP ribazoletransferase [Halovenus carboxidivorans]
MSIAAVRGAVGFLSRIPVGGSERDWDAFRRTPTVFPVVGLLLGCLLAPVFLLPGPDVTAAVIFVALVYGLTGITHLDGVADLGDAAVVHGDPQRRRAVMTDTEVGTGGVLGVALVVFALGTAAVGVAGLPRRALALVVVAEVGAKAAMAGVVCLGTAAHDGLGSSLTGNATARDGVVVGLLAAPAALLSWPRLLPGAAALLGAGVSAAAVSRWARGRLGGVSGDVLGATNELARATALHAGVMAWTLS